MIFYYVEIQTLLGIDQAHSVYTLPPFIDCEIVLMHLNMSSRWFIQLETEIYLVKNMAHYLLRKLWQKIKLLDKTVNPKGRTQSVARWLKTFKSFNVSIQIYKTYFAITNAQFRLHSIW